LGKLLEKIIARRLTYEVGRYDLVSTRQFGGRDKSSVIDACLTLTHDVQAAWKNGLVVSALAFDIKGYFDNINHRRLTRTMELLGFAPEVVTWVASFLSDRQVVIRVDGYKGEPVELIAVGIPQGSPLSMILSSISTAFVLHAVRDMLNTDQRAYVDDGLLVAVGGTFVSTIEQLIEGFRKVYSMLRAIGLDADRTKFDLMHFTRARQPENSPITLTLQYGEEAPESVPVFPKITMRWLGVFFHRKLDWHTHVKTMANRARSIVAGLRLLANTVRGISLANARLLYKTVVLPVLLFASPVWYTGVKQKGLIQPIITAQNEALRWLSGAFRTSPTPELHHLGAVLPIPLQLEKISHKAAIRLRTLPHSSQLVRRLPSTFGPVPDSPLAQIRLRQENAQHPPAIIHHLASQISPELETTQPYHTLPWKAAHSWGARLTVSIPDAGASQTAKDAYIRGLKSKISQADPATLLLFTDGSRRRAGEHRATGAGYSAFRNGREIHTGKWGLGRKSNVYDGEMLALAGAAFRATEIVHAHPTITEIVFLSDNQAALRTIHDTTDHAGQGLSIIFRNNVDHLLTTYPLLSCRLSWVPGHKGIAGNERADKLAKQGVLCQSVIGPTLTWARETANKKPVRKWRRAWAQEPHTNHAAVALRAPPSMRLQPIHRDFPGSRGAHARLNQAILGHAHIGAYYMRMNIPEPSECPCGEARIQTREHIIQDCELFEAQRHLLHDVDSTLSLSKLLGTKKGLLAMAAFLDKTSAFSKTHRGLPTPSATPQD
jgi:ribonuclease HI